MPRELRCTNLGGLSITPTSQRLEQALADRKGAGGLSACGAAACGCGVQQSKPLVDLVRAG
jgi:L-serine dehydratase